MPSQFKICGVSDNIIDLSIVRLKNIFFGEIALQTIRLRNVGNSSPTVLRLTVANSDWTFSGQQNWNGQEIVTRQFVEAKPSGGSWTPIGGHYLMSGKYLNLTPLAAGAYIDIELRLNIPADVQTRGSCKFMLCGAHADE